MNNDHDNSWSLSGDDPLAAGLRAAYGPDSTAYLGGRGGVLAALQASSGVGARVLLRDEPEEPAGLINPRSAEVPAEDRGTSRYQIAGEIARGGVGVVLRGRDVDLGREIAIKILRAEHASQPAMIRRLIEEAQIGGQLQHPGVLPVYEMGLDGTQRPYFTMKLVRGRTLASWLQDRPELAHERRRFLAIFEQVSQTMAYAHARGVIHRDLKPSNIMVGAFGEVQVVDWGLAKVLARGGASDDRPGWVSGSGAEAIATVRTGSPGAESEAGSVLGTPAYMAPEQANGEVESLDERCDVFALGAILCAILTGRPPYLGSRAEVLRQARAGAIEEAFARLDACGADADLIALAKRCLDPAREARPRDAGQVARAITAYLAAAEERTRRAEIDAAKAQAQAAQERRVRRLGLAFSVVLGLAVCALGVGYGLFERERHARLAATLDFEREHQARLARELAIERQRREQYEQFANVALATESKGNLIIFKARQASDREAGHWADVLYSCAAAAERIAAAAPDEEIRDRARQLFQALKQEEAATRKRASQ
jgi:hypothetical protein